MTTMDKEATSRVQMAALEAAREEERRLQTERVEAQRAAEAAQPPQPRPARSRLEEIVTNPGSVAGFIGLSPAAVRELIAKNVIPSCSAVEDSGGHTLIPVGLFKRWMDLGMPMHKDAADDVLWARNGRAPAPVQPGRRKLWTRASIYEWIQSGCGRHGNAVGYGSPSRQTHLSHGSIQA